MVFGRTASMAFFIANDWSVIMHFWASERWSEPIPLDAFKLSGEHPFVWFSVFISNNGASENSLLTTLVFTNNWYNRKIIPTQGIFSLGEQQLLFLNTNTVRNVITMLISCANRCTYLVNHVNVESHKLTFWRCMYVCRIEWYYITKVSVRRSTHWICPKKPDSRHRICKERKN